MSENFSKIQQTLRRIKNEHEIDLTHPHGVLIGGKSYPALGKHITLHNPLKDNSYTAYFRIPTENGMSISAGLEDNRKLTLAVMAPHTYTDDIMGGYKFYGHIAANSPTTLAYSGALGHGDPDEPHSHDYLAQFTNYSDLDVAKPPYPQVWAVGRVGGEDSPHDSPRQAIEKLSKVPLSGFATHGGVKGHTQLDEEGLAEHRKNFKNKPHDLPNTVTIQYSHPAYPKFTRFHYDVLTERLKEVGPNNV